MMAGLLFSCASKQQEARVLVFSKTAGQRHASIGPAIQALFRLSRQQGFTMDTTENAEDFCEENLKRYKAVIFLNTSGDILNQEQQNDFERFIQAGGGFAGIHAAIETEPDWPWYGRLVGARTMNDSPEPGIVRRTLYCNVPHPATDSLPPRFERADEYNAVKDLSPGVTVLIKMDEVSGRSAAGGKHSPMSWCHEYDGGKAFYTGMGHTEQSYSDPLFLKHLSGGLHYVLGGPGSPELDYGRARSPRVPQENRFAITVLAQKLEEPMELAVLDNGKVLIIERKGKVKLYSPSDSSLRTIASIPVSTTYTPRNGQMSEAEDGLLGLALDPDYEKNHWIYLYYSPAGGDPKNILTRYEFKEDALVLSSPKVMLEVPVQRDECCHTGGSIVFDKHGNLYLSTGDNTSPRVTGYSPIDERPGRSPWDAQKSSSNTNDLRGKIIRIHPEPDGTYSIPEGNLFPPGTEKARPEIYVMGVRNPFRISMDKRTGFLYWGDIGPDAVKPDPMKGPLGYDEFNQTKEAGFFGWPYFVGKNEAYYAYDFATGKPGRRYDAKAPVNNSPNNTGLDTLPPAREAFIWYPYDNSSEFPMVGNGGRSAMAGPVYYQEDFRNVSGAFPAYYDGKLFIYEWMRGWIMAVTMDKDGRFVQMERFMPGHKFTTPVDMAFGKDGGLYVLEYGSGWFQGNEDARLIRISYNGGNRKPVAEMSADRHQGAIPLKVDFSSKGTKDFDRDELKYQWTIVNQQGQKEASSEEKNFSYTFTKPGIYRTILTVTDAGNEKAEREIEVRAGNDVPHVQVELTHGNRSFYFPGNRIRYRVSVKDREDGTLEGGQIAPDQVAVTIDQLPEGFDKVHVAQGHQTADASARYAAGKKLMEESDCRSCHAEEKKSVGPSFRDIAERYKGNTESVGILSRKVINGGKGTWGEIAMPAHPKLSEEEASGMISYILSLTENRKAAGLFPPSGDFTFPFVKDAAPGGYIIRAAYTDRGAGALPGITAEHVVMLRSPAVPALSADWQQGIHKMKQEETQEDLAAVNGSGAYFGFENIDLTEVTAVSFTTKTVKRKNFGGKVEVHLDSAAGMLVGESTDVAVPGGNPPRTIKIPIREVKGAHSVYIVFKNEEAAPGKMLFVLKDICFHAEGK